MKTTKKGFFLNKPRLATTRESESQAITCTLTLGLQVGGSDVVAGTYLGRDTTLQHLGLSPQKPEQPPTSPSSQ
ncbi:hypothetical protein VTL71DRAFT_2303 [Oculimacula yallundae]|uniref:Uncharacterized protein n=1 Tax=Oculimacula yallundae TaxID=86028 RepID=A0ABR4C8H9_9HELO